MIAEMDRKKENTERPKGDITLASGDASRPQEPQELQELQEEDVSDVSDVSNVSDVPAVTNTLTNREQLVLRRRREQQVYLKQRGIGTRNVKKKIEQERMRNQQRAKIQRQNDLLKHVVSKRVSSGKSGPSVQAKQRLYPKTAVKSLLFEREVIERTRKTAGVCSAIFGSDVHVKHIFIFFLHKYGYQDLPPKFKQYFAALMQHYFVGEIKLYPEDLEFKQNLSRVLVFDDEKWFDNLDKLYKEYRLALKKENVERRWFPEELIMISTIWKQRIIFGDKNFEPIKLNIPKLGSIYVQNSPLRQKYLSVAKYLRNHTPKLGIIQINL